MYRADIFEVKILTPKVILALVLVPIQNKFRSRHVFLILIPMPEKMDWISIKRPERPNRSNNRRHQECSDVS